VSHWNAMPMAFRRQEYRGVEKTMPFYPLEDQSIGTIIKLLLLHKLLLNT